MLDSFTGTSDHSEATCFFFLSVNKYFIKFRQQNDCEKLSSEAISYEGKLAVAASADIEKQHIKSVLFFFIFINIDHLTSIDESTMLNLLTVFCFLLSECQEYSVKTK